MKSRFADNEGVRIHYMDSDAGSSLVPLVICPGLSETAEEYEDLMRYLLPRRCVTLSFRGRGRSDTPASGYGLREHVSDLASVVRDAELHRFHLYAHSRGVSYALGFAREQPSKVASLFMQEYPPLHKKMEEGWAERYNREYLMPFFRQSNIRPEAVTGIARDSEQEELVFPYARPLFVARGMLEDSLLDDDGAAAYRRMNPNAIVHAFQRSGHPIRSTERALLYGTIADALNQQ